MVVGTGFGCRIQIPALREAGFKVVGMVGKDVERTAKRAQDNGVPRPFTDLEEAILMTGARAVTIGTPPHTHADLALTAIGMGCHVMCEKPFAADAAEAHAMLIAAESAGIVHVVGHEFRWNPERVTLARLVHDGLIGEPRLANFTSYIPYLVDPAKNMPERWFDGGAGGGWLGAAGSHLIDWIRTLLGEFETLSASLQTLSHAPSEVDDTFTLRFRLKSGAEGVIQQSASAWGEPLDIVRVIGSEGTLWLQDGDVWLGNKEGSRTMPFEPQDIFAATSVMSKDPRRLSPKWQMLSALELPPYIKLCRAFGTLIRGAELDVNVPIPTFADGLAQMQVLDAIRYSAARDGELTRVRHSSLYDSSI